MTREKEELLEKCHTEFIEICFSDYPLTGVDAYVSRKITGYGTNINEKIQNFSDFNSLLKLQREESVGIEMSFSQNLVSKTILAEDNAAVYVDELKIIMKIEGTQIELDLRLSSVFEFIENKWWAVHFHGSLAQGVEGVNDTWAVNEWKQKNEALEKIITERTSELRQSLDNLKATQLQLIHAEKMASLGELTAGIAHEIQNPLNFVNNFSEVSNELIDEMNEELDKGDIEEAKALGSDVKQNL
ncbi:MAG: nuclear transport factor 2 family protein, partial [Nitrospinota bacterium]|nr:nuclear transport factor 2 family protein [Nitrospinota bacterium]